MNLTVEAYISELFNNIIIYKESIFETPRFVCQNDGCDYFHYNNNNIISVNFISNTFTFDFYLEEFLDTRTRNLNFFVPKTTAKCALLLSSRFKVPSFIFSVTFY